MYLLWLLAFDYHFPECTVKEKEDAKYYEFQTITIPPGQCFATWSSAMIGTLDNETKYKVSYKTMPCENGEGISNEIEYKYENPLFLNKDGSSVENYYKIQAVNPQKEIVLFFSKINPTIRSQFVTRDSFIVNLNSGNFNIISDKDKDVCIAFILKYQYQHVNFASNASMELKNGTTTHDGDSQSVTTANPYIFEIKYDEPTRTTIDYYIEMSNSVYDLNKHIFYQGIVPLINGPITYQEALKATFDYNQAYHDKVDSSYYSKCQHSYTRNDNAVKTFNLKSGECLRTSTPVILSGNKNYDAEGIVIDKKGRYQGTFTSQNPLFLSVKDEEHKVYSKITCHEAKECSVQVSKIIPTTDKTGSYVTTTNKHFNNKSLFHAFLHI
ncbi:hypothetical protein TVAG_244550 [Trichomonas vaginalis G3]|uniref:Uncharacterized protein n=1 Tax=Trichomonas vaginalis (strain ATCC PRA-98 / G3) TaxID=412133 RepID=A2ES42_TRIV3|nr:hypothetical protein TVAGG3_0690030 [Trichomonas vaginalis G3]EAY04554.1 hypothetical protein TVAG_244550 [Trichomonas vaginalis G3]KAI5508502.1 hypothetical protein TVAGG3_0690030 [Trichomonas vaginalis G3]|eukprot:XP_001316777.1 hypothetical protein [Trichomonas vaginalis G3]